jgi:Protein of unknown function (DUF2004)
MDLHSTKYFGEIDLDNVEEYYEIELELDNRTVELTINISTANRTIDKESINKIEDYIANLQTNEKDIRSFILEDFKEKGESKNYIDFQIEGQEKEDIADLISNADKKLNKREKLLSVLYLLRIGFYPETEDKVFAVYDYTIDDDLTDDLLVVILYKDNTARITIES